MNDEPTVLQIPTAQKLGARVRFPKESVFVELSQQLRSARVALGVAAAAAAAAAATTASCSSAAFFATAAACSSLACIEDKVFYSWYQLQV